MINDVHCHFFSTRFFEILGGQLSPAEDDASTTLPERLGWDAPGSPEALADRWVQTLDAQEVGRAAVMASLPGDEASVGTAVRRHPGRLVGMTMFNPVAPDADVRIRTALEDERLRCVCLFPALHGYPLDDEAVDRVFAAAAAAGAVVFVHCGVLTVGVRKKLGLPTPVDVRLGDPLALIGTAARNPEVPVIIPHFGGGQLRSTLMAADLCGNIHVDTSSSNGWIRYTPGLTLEAVFAAALETLGPERIVFGTDSSFFPRGWQLTVYERQRTILETLGVETAAQEAIMAGNFERLFPAGTPDR